jgi:hypothetical protein
MEYNFRCKNDIVRGFWYDDGDILLILPRKVLASDVLKLVSDRIRNRFVFRLLDGRFVILRTLMEDVFLEQVDCCMVKRLQAQVRRQNKTVTG